MWEQTGSTAREEAGQHLGGAEDREVEAPAAGGADEAGDSGVQDPGLHLCTDAEAVRMGQGGTKAGLWGGGVTFRPPPSLHTTLRNAKTCLVRGGEKKKTGSKKKRF